MTIREIKQPEEIWFCAMCGSIHDWESDAYECCQPKRDGVRVVYICPSCKSPCDSAGEAAKCCENPGDETVIVD